VVWLANAVWEAIIVHAERGPGSVGQSAQQVPRERVLLLGVRGEQFAHEPRPVFKRRFGLLLVAEAGVLLVDVLEHQLLADADLREILRCVH
jgi:hypothetical protein